MVNLLDFNKLAANFNQTGNFWTDGDFNYDGNVNLLDFNKSGRQLQPVRNRRRWSAHAAGLGEPRRGGPRTNEQHGASP